MKSLQISKSLFIPKLPLHGEINKKFEGHAETETFYNSNFIVRQAFFCGGDH